MWLKKDQEVLDYEVREVNTENQELEYSHYCKDCFNKGPKEGSIVAYLTKEDLTGKSDQKLLCDRCGKEIKP
jgi:hypothetical protein